MPWLQLRTTSRLRPPTEVENALLDAGALSVTLEDNANQPLLEPMPGETPLWDNVRVTGLFEASIDTAAISKRLENQLKILPSDLHWEILEDKDWEREWMVRYQPINCGKQLWICPSWLQPPEPDAINLLLDPGMAFGTGTHPTTLLCLQWLDSLNLSDTEIIDYGCGSGILAIASLLLGAETATCIDIDPLALAVTTENARRNNIEDHRIKVGLPDASIWKPADIVIANILAGPLTALAPLLASLTNSTGKLCLSGVMDTQADEVMSSYQPWFDFDPIAHNEQWVRLTVSKR